jgi:septal ring factor EnvC (AmiA/AmiB activator)
MAVDAPGTRVNLWKTPDPAMATRKTPQEQVQATLREAVNRTVSVGEQTRSRAQDAVDDLGKAAGRFRQQLEGRSPATHDDLDAIRAELRNLAKRIEKLEKKKTPPKKK